MKKILVILTATIAFATLAEDAAKPAAPRRNRFEILRERQMKEFGGYIQHPNSFKGKIVIANAQSTYGTDLIEAMVKELKGVANVNIRVAPCEKPTVATAEALVRKLDAQGVLFLTDDKDLPPFLCAPESRWTLVNVTRLAEGAEKPVANRRFQMEIARGFSYLAGAASSNYRNAVTSLVTSPKSLDTKSDIMPPVDVCSRFKDYLQTMGVTTDLKVRYEDACQEGWAPQPTNEFQKAVWDRVHAIPTNPIQIKFDPKKDK